MGVQTNSGRRVSCGLFLVLSVGWATLAFADFSSNVIYGGEDNRHEPFEVSETFRKISTSVAGKIPKSVMYPRGGGYFLDQISLGRRYCSKIRFSEQVMGPECTGFLVFDDLLVTAGHCMKEDADCSNFYWVFDYSLKRSGDTSYTTIGEDRVYRCAKVAARKVSLFDGVDYTIVQLDRKVKDRDPLVMDLKSEITQGLAVAVIGHPSGIPLKVTDSGTVVSSQSPNYFETNLDEFRGNSGSPVFDATSGKVIGIVSSGQSDYVWDTDGQCKVPRVCRLEDRCHWSLSSRVKNLQEDFEKLVPRRLFN